MAHQHQHHNHQHEHGHGHGAQGHAKTIGEHNKSHFDEVASTIWETPWIINLCGQVAQELRDNFGWMGVRRNSAGDVPADVKMLDYACGNGTASRGLAPLVPNIIGVDISSGMVTQYNDRAEKEGHSRAKMHAIQGDLMDPTATPSSALNTAECQDFDLAVIGLALHHVDDPDKMIAKLAERLKVGGVLVVVDWVHSQESGRSEPAMEGMAVEKSVSCMGFTEKGLKGSFDKAGLGKWGWKWFASTSEVPRVEGEKMQAFLARGVKQ